MAAEAVVKLIAEVTGLGNDKRVSCRALLSDVPTQAGGPLYQVFNRTPILIDTISAASEGEVVAMYVKCVHSILYVGVATVVPAVGAGSAGAMCIPDGQFNLYTFSAANTAVIYGVSLGSTAKAEVWYTATT